MAQSRQERDKELAELETEIGQVQRDVQRYERAGNVQNALTAKKQLEALQALRSELLRSGGSKE